MTVLKGIFVEPIAIDAMIEIASTNIKMIRTDDHLRLILMLKF